MKGFARPRRWAVNGWKLSVVLREMNKGFRWWEWIIGCGQDWWNQSFRSSTMTSPQLLKFTLHFLKDLRNHLRLFSLHRHRNNDPFERPNASPQSSHSQTGYGLWHIHLIRFAIPINTVCASVEWSDLWKKSADPGAGVSANLWPIRMVLTHVSRKLWLLVQIGACTTVCLVTINYCD